MFHRPAHFPCQASGSGQYLVQRVIGLPGETIWSDHQAIYVDGKRIAERGWYAPGHGAVSSVQISRTTIPTGDYFVLDDNRSNSCDSGLRPDPRVLGTRQGRRRHRSPREPVSALALSVRPRAVPSRRPRW